MVDQTLQHDVERSALADCLLIFAARGRALREARGKLAVESDGDGSALTLSARDTLTKNANVREEDHASANCDG